MALERAATMNTLSSALRSLLVFPLAVGLFGAVASIAACSSSDSTVVTNGPDGSTPDGSSLDGSAGCTGTAPQCQTGCASYVAASCVGDQWSCPDVFLPNCSDSGSSDAGDVQFSPGVYGGTGVQVTVAADESATIQFDCGSGTMQAITVTESGSTGAVFQVSGTVTQDAGGAQPVDGGPPPQDATFIGHKFGNEMAFTYTISGSDAGASMTFTATLGTTPNLTRCL
jgi:hypothetical protein